MMQETEEVNIHRKKLGLIVNPIAGMGGRVGLKGSDGIETLNKAKALGAQPESPCRALEALKVLLSVKELFEIITYPDNMGEDVAREAGYCPTIIGTITSEQTTAEDTIKAARQMLEMGVDLLMFAGGDGTARNIYEAIGNTIPVLGIPAGVKIHSAVYAINPKRAGAAAALYLENKTVNIREAEVMDIDEEAFRQGIVSARLYGYLRVPELKVYMQNVKSGGYSEKEAIGGIAAEIVDHMEDDVIYIVGPGTTTRSIMDRLGLPNTLLGVDVVCNKQVVASDVNEQQLYGLLGEQRAKIIVTVIGGQGHIFGRGNQQLSPRIIKKVGKNNMWIVATKTKLLSLHPAPLLVDTGDPILDQILCGHMRVITGYEDFVPYKVST
jgi:predicted polyphosphate/ATP-dependent NAD kinase